MNRETRAGRLSTALVLAVAVGLAASPLAAHDFWIVASSYKPAPGGPLAVRLKVGEHLLGDPVPRDKAQIERFALLGPIGPRRGETPVAGPDGGEPAGFAHIGAAGLYWIVYDGARNRLDLPAEKFEEALAKEGLERISALRRQRGESAKPSTEVFSRCAKALIAVGGFEVGANAAAGTSWRQPLGLELEVVPEANPYALAPGAQMPLRILYKGKPLAGALVVALHPRHTDGAIAARSGADGRLRLTLPAAGFWLIKAVHMVSAPQELGVDWESLWASLTFELPAR